MTPAWTVYAWPPILWQAGQSSRVQFVHMGTRVLSEGRNEPCCGQTVWGSAVGDGTAGVAWDWVELCNGVVAMADPFGFITNLKLVDENGAQLPSLQVALCINELVHELPWQAEVHAALGLPLAVNAGTVSKISAND